MEIINFKKEELKKLKTFIPNEPFKNQEASFYHYQNFLLKYFTNRSKDYFDAKLFNLNAIFDNEMSFINTDVIIPEKLFSVEDEITGFMMPYLKDTKSLEVIFRDEKVPLKDKIKLLEIAYTLIKKVHEIKINGENVFVGDIHAGNFIYSEKENTVSLVDTDSFYITNNTPFPSKYLINSSIIRAFPLKYRPNKNGLITPSINTDLFCYIIMFLNMISKTDMSLVDYSCFYNYLDYLRSLGLNEKFIFSLLKIYTNEENENPLNYLKISDYELLEYATEDFYKEKTGNSLILKR